MASRMEIFNDFSSPASDVDAIFGSGSGPG